LGEEIEKVARGNKFRTYYDILLKYYFGDGEILYSGEVYARNKY
jgi:hypothetical protein